MNSSDLCPQGYWILLRQAITIIGDGESGSGIEADKKNFRRKADLDDSLYIEHAHGSKVEGYKLCEFVYVSKPGTRASASLGLSLSKWCKLCLHLSKEENWSSLSERNQKAFKSYTGVDATPDNIRLAFKKGVLTSIRAILDIINKGKNEINVKDVIHSKVDKCFSFVFCADRTCTEHGVARGKALQSSFT